MTSELQFSFLFFIWVVRGPPSYGRRKKEEKKRYKGDYFKTQKQPSWERGPIACEQISTILVGAWLTQTTQNCESLTPGYNNGPLFQQSLKMLALKSVVYRTF